MNFESRIRITERGDSTASFQIIGTSEAVAVAHARVMVTLAEVKKEFAAKEQMDRMQGCNGCGEGYNRDVDA